jgi:hypothetical protein
MHVGLRALPPPSPDAFVREPLESIATAWPRLLDKSLRVFETATTFQGSETLTILWHVAAVVRRCGCGWFEHAPECRNTKRHTLVHVSTTPRSSLEFAVHRCTTCLATRVHLHALFTTEPTGVTSTLRDPYAYGAVVVATVAKLAASLSPTATLSLFDGSHPVAGVPFALLYTLRDRAFRTYYSRFGFQPVNSAAREIIDRSLPAALNDTDTASLTSAPLENRKRLLELQNSLVLTDHGKKWMFLILLGKCAQMQATAAAVLAATEDVVSTVTISKIGWPSTRKRPLEDADTESEDEDPSNDRAKKVRIQLHFIG